MANWKDYLKSMRSKMGGTGLTALQEAKKMGASKDEINKFIKQKGWSVGARAQEKGFGATSKPSNSGVKATIRAAGSVISKKEMNKIVKEVGGNVTKAINRIASVQSTMKKAGKTAPSVASGAANMLIRRAEKAPPGRLGMLPSVDFGTSKLGKTLQSMVARPATPGYLVKGQRAGGTAAQPGFNPGGRPDKNRMIGGTVIRPGGNIAVRRREVPTSAAAAPVAPAPIQPITEPSGVETDAGVVDMQPILDALDTFQMPEMPDFSGMFDSMVEQPSLAFDTPDPIQLAALGQAYGGDMIRARQRQRKSRRDYRRGITGASMANAFSPLMIGGGLTL